MASSEWVGQGSVRGRSGVAAKASTLRTVRDSTPRRKSSRTGAVLCSAAVSPPHRRSSFHGLDLREHTLANGLKAFIVPDRAAPVLTCQIWYRVGSGDEREALPGEDHGITGLSHFYEHLMFRGTERYPKFFDAVYERGGQLNAWTWLDATCYWEKLPAGHLRFALEAEADRLQNMRLGFLDIEPEREVVKSERMMRTDDDPSGQATELLHRRMFTTHPYGWPTVGWMHDLNRITLEEAEEYHRQHYVPANAFVVAVGDFDVEDAKRDLEETLGKLAGRPAPTLVARPVEPPPTGPRRGRIEHAVSAPILQVAWHAPAGDDDDFAVLEVLNHVLVRGKSGRLQRDLVFGDDPVATGVSASLFPMPDPYVHHWELSVKPGVSAAQAEARLLREIARIAEDPPGESELDKASLGLSADIVRGALTTQGKADAIGFAYLSTGDPLAWFQRVDRYADITASDLARVAASILDPERRTTICVTDPGTPMTAVRAHLGDGAEFLVEAMRYARKRVEIADKEADLDEEAAAIEHLEKRRQTALAKAADAGDDKLKGALEKFRTDDPKGPIKRAETLERSRADNSEARLSLEVLGADLRARMESPDPSIAAYLGEALPADVTADLFGDGDEVVASFLRGHLHDLRGEREAAQKAYGDCIKGGEGVLADAAWERLEDV